MERASNRTYQEKNVIDPFIMAFRLIIIDGSEQMIATSYPKTKAC